MAIDTQVETVQTDVAPKFDKEAMLAGMSGITTVDIPSADDYIRQDEIAVEEPVAPPEEVVEAVEVLQETQQTVDQAADEVTTQKVEKQPVTETAPDTQEAIADAETSEETTETIATDTEIPNIDLDENAYKVQAKQWIAAGQLPADYAITDDIDGQKVLEDWAVFNKTPYIQKWQQEFETQVSSLGLTPEVIQRALYFGAEVPKDSVGAMEEYMALGNQNPKEMSEEASLEFIGNFLEDSDTPTAAIPAIMNSVKENVEERENLLSQGITFYKNAGEELKKHNDDLRDANLQRANDVQTRRINAMTSAVQTGKVGNIELSGENLTKFTSALANRRAFPTQEGGVVSMTDFEAFESMMRDDVNAKLQMFALYLVQQNQQTTTTEQPKTTFWGVRNSANTSTQESVDTSEEFKKRKKSSPLNMTGMTEVSTTQVGG